MATATSPCLSKIRLDQPRTHRRLEIPAKHLDHAATDVRPDVSPEHEGS